MVVSSSAIGTLTVTSSFTSTSTTEDLGVTVTESAFALTVHAVITITVILTSLFAQGTLTVGLCRSGEDCAFEVNLYVGQARSVGSTEVIATSGATVATCSATEGVTQVAIGTACQVGLEVMTAAPCWTIACVLVEVVVVLVP